MTRDTVIVFGASRGLGKAIAIDLARAGFVVAAVCRNPDDAAMVAAEIEAHGQRALPLVADVTDYEAVEAAVADAAACSGGLVGIVNNAGVIDPIAPIGETDPAAWARLVSVNLVGAYNCVRASLDKLAAGGVVINVSSGAAAHALEGWSAYCSSKAALAMLTQSLALERPDIRAYGYRPGVVDTDMQGLIRASGINRVSKLKREELLDPAIPAGGISWLMRHAPAELSGQEIDIRDEAFRARMGS